MLPSVVNNCEQFFLSFHSQNFKRKITKMKSCLSCCCKLNWNTDSLVTSLSLSPKCYKTAPYHCHGFTASVAAQVIRKCFRTILPTIERAPCRGKSDNQRGAELICISHLCWSTWPHLLLLPAHTSCSHQQLQPLTVLVALNSRGGLLHMQYVILHITLCILHM